MTFVGKVTSVVISAGIVGGGIATSYYAFSNYETISQTLEKEGFKPLDTSATNGDWNTVFTAYKQATENTFTGSKDDSLTEPNLRNKCKELLNKKPNKEDYELARQWCVKEKVATEILKHLKLELLKTENGSGDTIADQEHWTAKVQKYEANKPEGFNVEGLEGDPKKKATAMRDACKKLNTPELKTTTSGFNKTIEKIKEWCSIEIKKEDGK